MQNDVHHESLYGFGGLDLGIAQPCRETPQGALPQDPAKGIAPNPSQGALPLDPTRGAASKPSQGALPLDPTRGIAPWTR